jgi:hypothetical protein
MVTLRYTAEQIRNQFGESETRQELFQKIEKSFVAEGQVVCQFRINGVQITEQDEASASNCRLEAIEMVEILVDQPHSLLTAVVTDWLNELPKMVEKADSLSVNLRNKGFQIHFTPFVALIDHCQFFVDTLLSLTGLIDLSAMDLEKSWRERENATVKAIGESLKAFEKRDANWLADVIEYDLAQCLQEWQESFTQLEKFKDRIIYRATKAQSDPDPEA